MKRCINSWKSAMAAGLGMALTLGLPATAAPVTQPAVPAVAPRSVFVIPANPQDGRDPFYPNSVRPYENAPATKKSIGDVTSLVLRGVSGPLDHRLAIINNRTLGVGDEQDINTPQGRIHIRCVEIKTNSVVIESGGVNHELKYNPNP
jgi:hypothetical protein